jgi:hypothetical protein
MKGVAEICANLLIPSLIVSEILKSFKISDYELWLPILIYCLSILQYENSMCFSWISIECNSSEVILF